MKNSAKWRGNEEDMNNMNPNRGNCPSDRISCNHMNHMGRGCMNTDHSNCKNMSMERMSGSCSMSHCKETPSLKNDPLRGMPVGIGYVPWQEWSCIYNIDEGLSRGTIFPALDLPFCGCIPRDFKATKGGRV